MSITNYHGRLGRQAMLLQEYQFTISYLPGEENSAADIVSRPTRFSKVALMVTTRSNNKSAPQAPYETTNQIDPYDDKPLIYYLINKKHLPGISTKQVNNVENKAEHYKINDNIISVKHYGKWKTVPFKEDRPRLIEQAHLLGHFGIESTYNRLEEDYFWKNMLNHVQIFIKKCMQCARNKSFTPIEHPAKAIPITGMFERIGMDITGDFPQVDGFHKLLVIKEYLSKFVRVFPLR